MSAMWVPRKLAAIRCHRTQMGADHPFDHIDDGGATLDRRRAFSSCAEVAEALVLERLSDVRRSDTACRAVLSSNLPCESRRQLTICTYQPSTSCDAPYCGGRLELVTSMFHRRAATRSDDGHPGVSVLPLSGRGRHSRDAPAAECNAARAHVEAGEPDRALRDDGRSRDESARRRFEAAVASPRRRTGTIVDALGPNSRAAISFTVFPIPRSSSRRRVVRAVAGTVLRTEPTRDRHLRRIGHLTRSLLELSATPPVLADLYFAKVWLGASLHGARLRAGLLRRQRAVPLRARRLRVAMCSDAFMYIWTKRQFVGEMERLVDRAASAASPGPS